MEKHFEENARNFEAEEEEEEEEEEDEEGRRKKKGARKKEEKRKSPPKTIYANSRSTALAAEYVIVICSPFVLT